MFPILAPAAMVASLQGRVDQLEELNKQLTEERDQFLERYYRLVTQFELMGGSFDRARAGITDAIGYLRGRPEKHERHEIHGCRCLSPSAMAMAMAMG